MLKRLCNPLLSRSFFLFGARGTGKTTLIKDLIPPQERIFINLLLPSQFDEFALNPEILLSRVQGASPQTQWVVIDEVQKLPRLLDVVHHLIEESRLKFVLTGSSARKLKRHGANLLAGRASVYNLFPLTARELGEAFSLQDAIEWGTLPGVALIPEKSSRYEFLQAYAHTYLKEEVAEEQVVRRLEPFRKFLAISAQCNGQILNYKKISDDVGASPVTVRSYYQILEDTLLGFFLEPFHESVRKSQRQGPKFYFIDAGIQRALCRHLDVPLKEGSYAYGAAFESFFINEVFRLKHYFRKDWGLYYLRTKDDAEIDLIIERSPKDRVLVEIKSTPRVQNSDAKQIARFASDMKVSGAFLASRDPNAKQFDNVRALPWRAVLDEIFEM